ncbi:MAG: hypothetical protein R3B72_49815 [Polyangiaceae bacterium]
MQLEIISPYGVAHVWGITGHRFVLSRRVDHDRSEIIGTILVGRSKDTLFFFSGRYNNVRHSTLWQKLDLEQPDCDEPRNKWFDRFAFPEIDRFKPMGYHHIANLVVAKEQRGKSLSRVMLNMILEKYARNFMVAHALPIEHSQHLLCGRGFWQIGDPPWLERMERLGFYLRWGAESFFIEHDWAPLPQIRDRETGEIISNVAYNRSFGLPDRYATSQPATGSDEHLTERVAEVMRLSVQPNAKLQYFQAMFNFV